MARSIPPSLAFDVAEDENRLAALRAAMEHQGVDVLVVTSPANLANDGPSRVTLRPGYVSNYETILFDREQRFESAAIDTVAVSEEGLQRLSRIPRELLRT